MTTDKFDQDRILRLHAAVDGELHGPAWEAFQRECAQNAAYRKLYEQMLALRQAMQGMSAQARMPLDIKDRIMDRVMETTPQPQDFRRLRFTRRSLSLPLAASLALAFALGGTLTGVVLHRDAGSDFAMQVVDDHRRALLAQSRFDVASSDRHTVKPWFDARLALSPPVVDLSQQGYPLLGGRVAVISGIAVPVLVYRMREHVITLTALPADRFANLRSGLELSGFRMQAVHEASFNFVAVSDVGRADLEAFLNSYRSESERPESQP